MSNKDFRMTDSNAFSFHFGVLYSIIDILRFVLELSDRDAKTPSNITKFIASQIP